MLQQPATKYTAFEPIDLPQRTWPNQVITQPPVWLSTDLRDGNQALIEPMSIARKLRLFRTLVDIGFKEIEVGFPAASQTEFSFIRHLIEQNLVPDDVTLQILTPAREALIRRSFEAVQGAKQAIVHVYNATAPTFRQVVFNLDKAGTIQLATEAAKLIKHLAIAHPETQWRFQYSPEVFTSTELPFAREICNAVLNIWQPTAAAKAIINLPASVEVATPNVFADQVEWMHQNLDYRESVVLCVHPHNDRGCSVAAAELAQMAGAERVEGCLFGNGERTGNVDLVTLAMNLYTQGISPGLDFSRIDEIVRIAEDCTQLPVHPRHPYAGELVFTAFSGSHQDAIKKGFAVRQPQDRWAVPYLPMDPADVGRSYESVVRVNSQSGKGGIAFLLEKDYGVQLPRKLQIEFSQIVQKSVDISGQEMTAANIWEIFQAEYLRSISPFQYLSHQSTELENGRSQLAIQLSTQPEHPALTLSGAGNGPVDAFINALNAEFSGRFGEIEIRHYEQRSLTQGSNSQAIALIEIATRQGTTYGIGIHVNIVAASFNAIISALNRNAIASESTKSQTNLAAIGN
ncbi:MAG: 2-isopropylmalate synthase [Leptolyngbya foveolarum]|uniref:2-isopropylmalate synthase n=1 Tax=Leptolyngbya foveolarum TaxID=47253 RepID=A0A2W4UNX7_9CYAN|nr:MAG: 2-isopropylmalate synthase [Leptolyngbya foveolarum]